MAENLLEASRTTNALGKVEIATEVVEVIAGIATTEVDGVWQMRGSFAGDVVEKLGKKNHGKGVKVELTEEGLLVDVYILVKFGSIVPQVAKAVQENVRQTLINMIAVETKEVNVHIVGVGFDQPKQEKETTEQ